MKINIETKIDMQILEDIFVTALEGGSNYWLEIHNSDMKLVRQVVPKDKEEIRSLAIYKAVCEEGLELPIFDAEDEDEMQRQVVQTRMAAKMIWIANLVCYAYALFYICQQTNGTWYGGYACSNHCIFCRSFVAHSINLFWSSANKFNTIITANLREFCIL